MKKNIYIDITGLSYKYQSGVQNTLWGLVDAAEDDDIRSKLNIIFYDCSGKYNERVSSNSLLNYVNFIYSNNNVLSILVKKLYDFKIISFDLNPPENSINHVWNWGIQSKKFNNNSITIHDLFPLEYKNFYSKKMQNLTSKSVDFALNSCTQIQSVSQHTKNQFLNFTNINENKITVVYPPINKYYLTDEIINDGFFKDFGLKKYNYFISIGYLDPRKNLLNQIQAFKKFILEKNYIDIKYALTGFKNSFSDEILEVLNDPIIKDRVVFLEFVSIEKLKCLITNSLGLLYCSIAEGFGIPIVEAYACRTNVITSNTTSMKELGQDRAFLVDPNSIDEICDAINKASLNRDESKIEQNYQFARNFTPINWFKGHFLKDQYILPK
jgi:glycosyltransferase involved in cell wall biosynthesis